MKTGVQSLFNYLNRLDSGACPGPRSGVRRNDKKWDFSTFYETVKSDKAENMILLKLQFSIKRVGAFLFSLYVSLLFLKALSYQL